MRAAAILCLLVLAAAGQDEWRVAKPKGKPRGKAYALAVALDPGRAHHATVTFKQTASSGAESRTHDLEFETTVRVMGPAEKGGTKVGASIEIKRLVVGGQDLSEKARRAALGAYVEGLLDARRIVRRGTGRNTEALGPFAELFPGIPAWVLPWLPDKPVRRGEVWEVPGAYLLWNIRQHGHETPEGEAWQLFERVEKRDGVSCARLKTVFGLLRRQKEAPAQLGLGEGPFEARFQGEITDWFGLDGYLRESRVEARMHLKSVKTDRAVDWHVVRTVKAGPAPVPDTPLGKDWSRHMGKLPFVVGYEEGMKEARFTGRPPMFFFTSVRSDGGRQLGRTAFRDKAVLAAVAGYTPVIIDAEVDKEFPKKFEVFMEPTLYWIDFDGDVIFQIAGAPPLDMLKLTIEVPKDRTPDPTPSPEYAALVKRRDELRAAMQAADRAGAVNALLAIREVGRGLAIQREARAADKTLTAYGEGRLADAEALRKKRKSKEARLILEALVAEFGAHPVGARARAQLERNTKR